MYGISPPAATPPTETPAKPRWTIRDLPLAGRLTLATFLISVGVGYASALVQLHFQHAEPGSLMPTPKNAVNTFHGGKPMSMLIRLIEAPENKPLNGTGQMSQAFTTKTTAS